MSDHTAGTSPGAPTGPPGLGPSRADGTYAVRGMPGRGMVVATTLKSSDMAYLTGVGADRIEGRDKAHDHYFTWPYIVNSLTHNTLG